MSTKTRQTNPVIFVKEVEDLRNFHTDHGERSFAEVFSQQTPVNPHGGIRSLINPKEKQQLSGSGVLEGNLDAFEAGLPSLHMKRRGPRQECGHAGAPDGFSLWGQNNPEMASYCFYHCSIN